MTARVCSFEGCDRPHRARGWCEGHYRQWRAGKPLTPIRNRPRVLTPEIAELDIDEFEFLLSSGETLEQAVNRMGVRATTLITRYKLLDRPVPAGLWGLGTRQYKRASS